MKAVDALVTEDLPTAACAPHEMAFAALDDAEGSAFAAVAWCSAHLVAAHRVLYAEAAKRLPDGARRVRAQRAVDHRLEQAVCRLDRKLTGDTHLCATSVTELAEDVRGVLSEHAAGEAELVADLIGVLDDEEQEQLATRLARAMRCAPTRPHPHTRRLPLGALVSRLDACIDRARDLMDNRLAPTPYAARAPRTPGRWGCYLMGTPYPTAPVDEVTERAEA